MEKQGREKEREKTGNKLDERNRKKTAINQIKSSKRRRRKRYNKDRKRNRRGRGRRGRKRERETEE